MTSRRQFLKLSGATGVGLLLSAKLKGFRAWGLAPPLPLLDPLTQPKFVNPLPNPLDPSFIFQPTNGNHYEIGIFQFEQALGLVDPVTGVPLLTTVWGYGSIGTGQSPTYPGRSFEVRRDQETTVRWTNNLGTASDPLPHILPVDSTLHWADPLGAGHEPGPYTGPVPVVTHVHGGHSESDSDGLPEYWFTPDFDIIGPRWVKEPYEYDNDQEAGTIWYHDHALGITRLNVYAGLAGFYIIRDGNEDALVNNGKLPTGPYEIPVAIQDRTFLADGSLWYPSTPMVAGAPDPSVLPEFFGDVILVNGQAWPVLEVEPRQYRLRLLNGSDSRFYTLFLSSGQVFFQIGTDNGLLNAPVAVTKLTIGPGERADVVVDFSNPALAGKTIVMKNNAKSPFPKGAPPNPRTAGQIMAFRVSRPLDANYPLTSLPTNLRPVYGPLPAPAAPPSLPVRQLLLFEGTDMFGRLEALLGTTTAGALLWDDEPTENPTLDSTEVWEIYNTTPDAHPIHLHLVSFRILNRQKFSATQDPATGALTGIKLKGQPKPPAANEAGLKDTAQMFPGEVTRIIVTFDRPGRYVWHCHILSHEDHEMMRPYYVVE